MIAGLQPVNSRAVVKELVEVEISSDNFTDHRVDLRHWKDYFNSNNSKDEINNSSEYFLWSVFRDIIN